VDDHSNFEAEILNRLFRTLEFMHDLVFCDRQTAQQALRHFHALHQRIRGQLKHRSGHLAPQTDYSGTDPHAKLWVFATFIDTNIRVYEQFIRPLTPNERQHYYADALILARLMEIPEEVLPLTWEEFQEYINHMVHSNSLAITPTTRRLAHGVLYPKVGLIPALSATLLRFVTTGLLNNRFRRAYGLNWSFGDQVIFKSMHGTTRLLRPFVPPWIWQGPLLEGKLTYFLLWGISQKK